MTVWNWKPILSSHSIWRTVLHSLDHVEHIRLRHDQLPYNKKITPSSTSDGTATPLPNAGIGSLHSPPDLRSYAPVSRCNGGHAPTNWVDSPLLASSSDHQPANCKIVVFFPHRCQHCRNQSIATRKSIRSAPALHLTMLDLLSRHEV